jgi:orotidine-5'-phosphate decarboxylase
MMTVTPFSDRLAEAVLEKGSPLVVGLDPFVDRLPTTLLTRARRDHDDPRAANAAATREFLEAVLEDVAPHACAVKPQSAFFEAMGPAGLVCWEALADRARELGLLVIGDVKRGDIGSTAAAYVEAYLAGPSPVDAVTLNPYLGTDSLKPFLDRVDDHGAGLFVLVRTSNPSATELQDQPLAEGLPVHELVARMVATWGASRVGECGYSSVGAVVGATAPRELEHIRRVIPHAWFLVPGVGAQGGRAADVAAAFDARGLGAVVNSSRGILYAFGDADEREWRRPIGEAARTLAAELRDVAGLLSPTSS